MHTHFFLCISRACMQGFPFSRPRRSRSSWLIFTGQYIHIALLRLDTPHERKDHKHKHHSQNNKHQYNLTQTHMCARKQTRTHIRTLTQRHINKNTNTRTHETLPALLLRRTNHFTYYHTHTRAHLHTRTHTHSCTASNAANNGAVLVNNKICTRMQ